MMHIFAGRTVFKRCNVLDTVRPSLLAQLAQNISLIKSVAPAVGMQMSSLFEKVVFVAGRQIDVPPAVAEHVIRLAPEFGFVRDAFTGKLEGFPPKHFYEVTVCKTCCSLQDSLCTLLQQNWCPQAAYEYNERHKRCSGDGKTCTPLCSLGTGVAVSCNNDSLTGMLFCFANSIRLVACIRSSCQQGG